MKSFNDGPTPLTEAEQLRLNTNVEVSYTKGMTDHARILERRARAGEALMRELMTVELRAPEVVLLWNKTSKHLAACEAMDNDRLHGREGSEAE